MSEYVKEALIHEAALGDTESIIKLKEYYPELGDVFDLLEELLDAGVE